MQSDYKSRILDMTKGSPFQLLLYFSLPLFFGNLLQQLYSLTDTSIAGHLLGDGALARLGVHSCMYLRTCLMGDLCSGYFDSSDCLSQRICFRQPPLWLSFI